ncbi:hypothetical protein RHMOL_Rhmol04G0197500 [Rhododendron molle]|uniref:Uncharacterized protein n=1 Tax=Rhododendron molle TaxID=49168 RepID=A0ACC0P2G0_RHOML|nr:hypothetical protein RHMOL_Rhmol04G0197500 [Rhododendron molle]
MLPVLLQDPIDAPRTSHPISRFNWLRINLQKIWPQQQTAPRVTNSEWMNNMMCNMISTNQTG